MHELIFKGVSSKAFPLLTVRNLGKRKRATQDIEVLDVPLANRSVTITHDTFQPYARPMSFMCKDYETMTKVFAWLTGVGRMETSDDVGYYFRSFATSFSEVERVGCDWYLFDAEFIVDPLAYRKDGETPQVFTAAGTITNPGTWASEPIVKVTGTDGTVSIGGKTIQLKSINGTVTIDSDKRLVYTGTLNQGKNMVGDFPVLTVGDNTVSFSGNITKVEIIPRWCEV